VHGGVGRSVDVDRGEVRGVGDRHLSDDPLYAAIAADVHRVAPAGDDRQRGGGGRLQDVDRVGAAAGVDGHRLDLAEGEREGLAVLGDHHAVFGVQVDGDIVGEIGTELVAGDEEGAVGDGHALA